MADRAGVASYIYIYISKLSTHYDDWVGGKNRNIGCIHFMFMNDLLIMTGQKSNSHFYRYIYVGKTQDKIL